MMKKKTKLILIGIILLITMGYIGQKAYQYYREHIVFKGFNINEEGTLSIADREIMGENIVIPNEIDGIIVKKALLYGRLILDGSIDFSQAKDLERVEISNYDGSDKLEFKNNKKLKNLAIIDSSISSIDLNGAENLSYLEITHTGSLKSLDVSMCSELNEILIKDCSNLNNLILDGANNLGQLFIRQCPSLNTLDVHSNLELNRLDIYNNAITTLLLPESTDNFDYLNIGENEIESLNVSNYPNLTYLSIEGTHISSLDISNNLKLSEVNCSKDKLSEFIYSESPYNELKSFIGSANLLTEFDIVAPNLEKLILDSNKLTIFDATKYPNMQEFSIHNNQISEIDVRNMPNLTILGLINNKIQTLDVSQNKNLLELYCGRNSLTSLNVDNNPELKILICPNNAIQELNLANNTKLTELSIINTNIQKLDLRNLPDLYDYRISKGNKTVNFIR